MSPESAYEVFWNVDDDDRESEDERDRYTRYHDAFLTVDDAYKKLKNAIEFNAFDADDEARLNDLRKRLFYFQRKAQEQLYALRDADPDYQKNIKVIENERSKRKAEQET